jgi:hypothetical protein
MSCPPGFILLKERVDGLVLSIEVAHVDHKILDDKHVWQWCHLHLCLRRAINLQDTYMA